MRKIALFTTFFFTFLLGHSSLQAQTIEIPRVGFPYCEPFTGMGPFDNTSFGGEIRDNISGFYDPDGWRAQPNGQSLTLTPKDFWHSGYAIVEIPFSSQFGIRTSFEYFTYGGNGADGISFFMFDADVPFNLGYLGGSLGYAPYVDPSNGNVIEPGISGGYIGIGFDENGNFGNGTVGEPIANWEGRVGNSVSIRAPESENYDLWNREVTVPFNSWMNQQPPFPPSQHFNIESDEPSRVIDCLMPGYRKVFIELDPIVSGVGYNVKITMLVNTGSPVPQVVNFPPVPYPFAAPERLKIGFAGATGFRDNNHEIRNVSVNVFDASQISEPKVAEQVGVICENDSGVDMEFKVELSTPDAFITCLQLFKDSPGPPDNVVPSTNFLACGMDGNLCRNKCDPLNYEEEVFDVNGNLIGTFYSELQDLNTGNFNQIRDVVNVKFVAAPGFVGEALVYYNVTDNYGLTSQPEVIRIVSNPFPVKVQDESITNPSCDGQQDGRIYDLIVGDLVAGFDYDWQYNGTSIGKAGATASTLVNGQVIFELTGVNLGIYTLNVWNPSDSPTGGCYEPIDVIVDREDGTPIIVEFPDQVICEGEEVTFVPQIDPAQVPPGAVPSFLWYSNANRTGGAFVNGSTVTIGGSPVNVSISPTGELTLTGLKYNGASSTYEFFVEAAGQSQAGSNFCPYIGDVLTRATVVVNAPLSFTVSNTDDWCIESLGEIVGSVSGPTDITYSLLDANDQVLATNSTGVFSSLSAGDYKVFGVSASLGCSTPIEEITIQGPTEGLLINPGAAENAFCALPNGSIAFEVSGGNLPYQSIKVNGTEIPSVPSGSYNVSGLAAAQYTIEVIDDKGCILTQTMEVMGDQPSNFTAIGSEVCEGKVGTATLEIQDPSTGTPIFEWYYQNTAGDYVLISDGMTVGDYSYQIGSDFQLSVSGLLANPDPYIYYLLVSGDRICDQGYIRTEIKVTLGPEMNAPLTTETCYGESLGTIQAQIPGNNYGDFEFSLIGDNGVNIDFVNNGGVFENLPAGTYQLSIKNALDCITTLQDVEVLEPAEPISLANQTIERASCDLANGAIKDLQITGGWGNYTVEWRKGAIDGAVIPGDLSGAIDLLPDTYYMLLTDEKGCIETFEFIVGELSYPVYDLVPPIDVCQGEKVEIRPIHLAPDPSLPPAAFTEVFWYKNPGQNDLISNGPDGSNADIIYTIDDSDWLNPKLEIEGLPKGAHTFYFNVGCTGQEIEVDVEVFDVPEVGIDTTPISCLGGNDGKIILISGTDDSYTYSIDSGTPVSQAELELMSFSAGDYQFQVFTPAGCPQSLSFTIEGPEGPLLISPLEGIDPGCGALNGKINATITGGWLPYTVSVFGNGTVIETLELTDSSLKLDGLASGTYSITVRDAQGCEISSPSISLVDGPSQILVDKQGICEGQEAIFTPTIDPAASGVVFEWYFDANTTQKINTNSTPDANGVTYLIDPGTGALTVNGLTSSSNPYIYYVTAQGAGVCPGFVANATAMVYSTPTATLTTTNEVCFGDGGKIVVQASGGSGAYTFVLDGQISQTSGVFENVPKGLHSISVTTPETCEITLSAIEILGPSSPLEAEILTIKNPTCGLFNGAITLGIQGGNAGYSVNVLKEGQSQGILQADANGQVIVPNIAQGQYEFEITDSAGCFITLAEPLDLVEVPTEIILNDQSICVEENAELTPSVVSNVTSPAYTWFFDEQMNEPLLSGVENGVTYQIASDGKLTISGLPANTDPYVYYAMVSGPEVCGISPKRVQVFVNTFPNLRVSNPSIVCDPMGTVDLTNYIEGYNPSVYEYSILSPLGNALVGNEVKAVNESGNYVVSASFKGTTCWTATQRILVRIASELLQSNFEYHADLGGGVIVSNQNIQLLENVQFEDFSTGDVLLWNWDFGDGTTSTAQNPNHIFQNNGTYTVTLTTTDTIGCQSVYTVVVEVTDEYLLIMPNAFTPDGNKNQYFKPEHRGLAGLEFYLFNTWGELIYKATTLEDIGWDGTHNGKPAPNGNYVYKVKYRTRSGNVFDEAGVFILIR